MTISRTDIKLRKSERMTDNADGGGRQTAVEVVDGELNNVFDDSSRLDRATGRVSLRKTFLHVDTENTATLLGSHAILTDPPDDPGIHVSMFSTGSPTDQRTQARNRVESYVTPGPPSPYIFYGVHVVGQRTIRLSCRPEIPSPDQSETLILRQDQSGYPVVEQYVRIESVDSRTVQTFTDAQGDYQRAVIVATILAPLREEFVGADVPPRRSDVFPPTRVRLTQVADAATYFSVAPLTDTADLGDLAVHVESPYIPIVPTATAETAIVDQTPYADAGALVQSGPADGLTASGSLSAAANEGRTLYLGRSILRGSLRVSFAGTTLLRDDGGGGLIPLTPLGATDGYTGTVDYIEGSVTVRRTSSWSTTVALTATVAGWFVAPPFTREERVTTGNRGYVHVFSCIPLPAPGTLTVSYRALGRWYTLRDGGLGTLSGASPAEGSGSVSFSTGSVEVTLGALPDIDSSLIVQWGTGRSAIARYGDVAIQPPVIRHTLEDPPEPGSLTITWLAGAVERTATASVSGIISGDATGVLSNASGELLLRPTLLPDANTTFEFDYTAETLESAGIAISVASFTASGTIPASGTIKEGAVSVEVPYQSADGPSFGTYTERFFDDGIGGWINGRTGSAVSGTINYTTGAFSIVLGGSFTSEEPIYTYERVLPYGWIRQTLTGWETITHTVTPVAGTGIARWRLASVVGASRTEELIGPALRLDLTPLITDQIVSGSVRFSVAGRRYVDRVGALYHSVSASTDAGTLGGTLSLASGDVTITDYTGGGAANAATIESLLTVAGEASVNTLFFRVPVQSLKRSTLSVRGNRVDTGALITGTADINGIITGTGISGEVDAEMAIVRVAFGEMVTAAGNEAEPWYIAGAVVDGQIFRPIAVDPSSIRYNAVAVRSIPIDADVIQLDPIRLPVDGRVPWVRPGNVAVIHHTDILTVASPAANDISDVGRERCTEIHVRDDSGEPVVSAWYTIDLDAGTVTWADPLDLSAYDLPIRIQSRIEDMIVVSDVQINGEIGLSRALTHDFPAGSVLSTALIAVPQDMTSRVTGVFAQTTWSGVWSDTLIGSAPSANYNTLAYPIVVRNDSAMTGRYRCQFTSTTAFTCFLEGVGGIGDGTTTADFSPVNPLTGLPYFTIAAAGWGTGWASGNLLRFNVQGASHPIWLARCTLQGPLAEPEDAVRIELRGDAN